MIEVGMNARADLKNAKYLRKAQSMDADFSPLVVETHGRFHAGLLKRLATSWMVVERRGWPQSMPHGSSAAT